jgi:diacylglycerol kinase family enzyme
MTTSIEPPTTTTPRPLEAPGEGGAGIAVLVNANAKRGGRRVAAQIARALPSARVRLTRSQGELDAWLREILPKNPPLCILAAGGDGTAIALVNALARQIPEGPLPPVGFLKLGTGNAWANVVGAPKLSETIALLRTAPRRGVGLPLRRFGLVDCNGTLSCFAGCGWDAQILNDYKDQLAAAAGGPPRFFAKSVYGYLTAMLFRTAPKTILFGRPHVIIENLGDEVYTMTADQKLLRLADVKHGTVLYDGPASVAGAATVPEYGYHFKAFPHAERFLGMINVRIYDRTASGAIASIPKLWRGTYPLRGMHDWFAKAVRMTFSRPMPLEIGGDAVGLHRTIELRVSPREARVLDWRLLRGT